MATIASIIRNGKGTAGAWRVVSDDPADPFSPWIYRTLWHYSTPMAEWREFRRTGERELVMHGIGHGSKSDQNGMNTLFRELGFPYYYSRAGGAEVIALCTCDRFDFPHQHAPACDV